MLLTFAHGTEEGTDFYEIKNEFIEKWGSPKKFFNSTWPMCKEVTREGNQEMKERWPILIVIAIIAFLPFVVSLIFGWC